MVEVKGPNDKLSEKQKIWLHYFMKENVEACVCYVNGKF